MARYCTWPWVLCAFTLLGLAAFSTGMSGAMVFDDLLALKPSTLEDCLWPDVAAQRMRGLVMWTFAVNYALHGYDVFGYHVVNLAIHVVNATLVFVLLSYTLERSGWRSGNLKLFSLFVAAVFLVHPLQTNVVVYIVQRMESVMAMWLLLSFYCLVQYFQTKGIAWGVMVVACSAFGMRSKEVMVVAPVLLCWYDYAFLSGSLREMFKQRGGLYAALAVTWILNPAWQPFFRSFGSSTSDELRNSTAFEVPGLSRWEYLRSQPEVILEYVGKVLWPSGLCLDRGWPVQESMLMVCLAGSVILCLLAATLLLAIYRPKMSFVGVWFFLILAPTSSFVPLKDLYFEHRMYLPMLSVVFLAALCGEYLVIRISHKVMSWAGDENKGIYPQFSVSLLSAMCVAVLSMTTNLRSEVYSDRLSVYEDCIQKSPLHARPYYMFAQTVDGRKDEELYGVALHYAEMAVELNPDKADYWNVLGLMYRKNNRDPEAIQALEYAAEIGPNSPLPYLNLGNIFVKSDPELAEHYFAEALERDPRHEDANNNYGIVLRQLGRGREAIPYFKRAIQTNPELWPAYLNLADLYVVSEPQKALETYTLVPEQFYDSPLVYNNIAEAILRTRQDFAAALTSWRRAVERFPEEEFSWLVLANVYIERGDIASACALLSEARSKCSSSELIRQKYEQLCATVNNEKQSRG